MASKIGEVFAELKRAGRIALMPFLPAGYPDLESTRLSILAAQAAGASLLEIGFPFSDPIADGPVIQAAFTAALAKKVKINDILQMVRALKADLRIPLVVMASYSLIYRFGLERFLAQASDAGFSGLILPDLPPPEAQSVCQQVRAAGLDTILLLAPTTAPERIPQVVGLCSGFVYYMSITGITGERDRLPDDLQANLRQVKSLTQTPVCVGFGIHKAAQVRELAGIADGAIVGTAFVRRMTQRLDQGPEKIAQAVGDYCRELLSYGASPAPAP